MHCTAQGQYYYPTQNYPTQNATVEPLSPQSLSQLAPSRSNGYSRDFASYNTPTTGVPIVSAGTAFAQPYATNPSSLSQNDSGCTTGSPSCVPENLCQPKPRGLWYASAAGLVMGRNKPNRVWTTYENNNNANQLMNTRDVDPDWTGGADLRLGRYIACNRWAIELGYWSVDNFSASSSQTNANSVSSPLQFNDLEFAVGDPVQDYFDSAAEHRLSRRNELHNVELNLIQSDLTISPDSVWTHRMLMGIRFFKFDEDLIFSTLDQGGTWGGNGGLDEVSMSSSVENNLLGVQLGCLFQRRLGSRARFFVTPKVGVYNNRIENRFDLRRGDGTAAVPSSFSNVSGSYPVESATDVVSFLTEIDAGIEWQLSHNWSIYGGYRVIAISGIGLSDNQIPQYIVDIPEIADIDTNGSLVLQGAFAGLRYRF